jgi:hypothetical protein
MPSASVTKFNRHHTRRRPPPIIDEVKHALEQLEILKQYPGREQAPEVLPQREWSPWPRIDDEE